MTVEKVINALDFSIEAYQKLIDEKISDGEVVGSGVIGKWSANTPLNKAYQDMIDAFKAAIEIIYKNQKIEQSKSALLYKIYMAGVNMSGSIKVVGYDLET